MKNKVLVVDDEPEQIAFTCAVLRENGYATVSASNGIEGMQMAKTEKPDVILLDILMPERGGIGMYQDLKEDKETKHIPVIIVTGVAQRTHFHKFLSAEEKGLPPPDGFLEKPMNPDSILALLHELLS